jgi:hypothetical protein
MGPEAVICKRRLSVRSNGNFEASLAGQFLSATYPKRVHTTGSFPVAQLNSRQKSFVAFGNVPNAVVRDLNLNEWSVRGELRSLGTGHRLRYIVTISVTAYLALIFIAAMQASSVNLPK